MPLKLGMGGYLKIKQEGQTAFFGPCFHLPGQAILVPVFEPQPNEKGITMCVCVGLENKLGLNPDTNYPAAGAFNGRPDPSIRHPEGVWGSQNPAV